MFVQPVFLFQTRRNYCLFTVWYLFYAYWDRTELLERCAFKGAKETRSFSKKIVPGKKKSAILNGVLFRVKYIPSLLAYKILHFVGFFSSKVTVYAWFLARLFKSAEFFFLLATLPSQKIVIEIAYILTGFQALLKAHFLILSSYTNCS